MEAGAVGGGAASKRHHTWEVVRTLLAALSFVFTTAYLSDQVWHLWACWGSDERDGLTSENNIVVCTICKNNGRRGG